jgi:hypothetical protein
MAIQERIGCRPRTRRRSGSRELALMFTVPPVRDLSGRPAAYGMGLSRLALPNGVVIWGKDGARWGSADFVTFRGRLPRRA